VNISLSDLTLREKIGQTAVVQSSTLINMEFNNKMDEYLQNNPVGVWHVCNVAMQMANLENVTGDKYEDSAFYRNWTKRVAKCMKVPPFIALDPPNSAYATDMADLVNPPVVGASNSKKVAEDYGKYQALCARALGANWVWALNVDIPSRFNGVCIHRQVSSDRDTLSALSKCIVNGCQENNVAMTAKHFPGMDKEEYRDSHFVNTCNNLSLKEWKEGQGKVFQDMIDSGVYSVMTGHQSFPAVDDTEINGDYIPTTLSHKIITGLLKKDMGFDGVVVTDGIEMGALKAIYPKDEDLYIALINAGNDVLLGVSRLDYVDIIEKAVIDGRISEERIDDACERILNVKRKIGLFDDVCEVEMNDTLKNEITAFNTSATEHSIILQCDKNNILPLDKDKVKNVAILAFSHSDNFLSELEEMKKEFEKRGINVRLQRRIESYDEMNEISNENDLIIYTSYVVPHSPMGGSGLFCDECKALFYAFTSGKSKSVGVSMGSPYVYYDYFIGMDTFVHALSNRKESQVAFVKALFGELSFDGVYQFEKPWDKKRGF